MDSTRETDTQPPPDRRLPEAPRKRQVEEWALVLEAEGLHPTLIRTPNGYGLAVPSEEQPAALEILAAWQRERAERAERQAQPPPPTTTPIESAAAYALALSLLAFHIGLTESGRWGEWVDRGTSRAALVLDGQAWRVVTALTLHADLAHVAGNALFGGLFLAALAGRTGLGIGVLAFVVSGSLGNLANALYYGSAHASIGASTGVFGLVGWLAGLAAWRRHRLQAPGRGAWVGFGAGLALLAMTGSGKPGVDFSAHVFGLMVGAGAGFVLAAPLAHFQRPGRAVQIAAFALAIGLVASAWHFA